MKGNTDYFSDMKSVTVHLHMLTEKQIKKIIKIMSSNLTIIHTKN